MFKDFSDFNESQSKILQPKSVFALRDAISTQSGLLSELGTLVGRYTRAYNSVQVIKYDENGDPIDVTPDEQLTVPENVLASVKARIDQIREQLDEYRDIVSDLTQSLTVTTGEWYTDPNGSYRYNLAGHSITKSQLGSNLPWLPEVPNFYVKSGSQYAVIGLNPNGQYYVPAGTLPDAIMTNGEPETTALCWAADNVFLAAFEAEDNDPSVHIFCDGKDYLYQWDGTFVRVRDDSRTQAVISFADFLSYLTVTQVLTTTAGLAVIGAAAPSSVIAPIINLAPTDVPKYRVNDFESDVQAIVIDNIIVSDQNLLDVKSTL